MQVLDISGMRATLTPLIVTYILLNPWEVVIQNNPSASTSWSAFLDVLSSAIVMFPVVIVHGDLVVVNVILAMLLNWLLKSSFCGKSA